MNVRIHPARRRKQLGPRWLHLEIYGVLLAWPPRITSVALQSKVGGETYTHNFYTGRNTLSARDLANVTWGRERGRQEARRRGHHVISVLLGVAVLVFLAVIIAAVVAGLVVLHAFVH